ncbi:MAG: 2-oxoglutarate dehydrogenase complex dihydrolipoyllysine-residue succinyltransferase [Deltaproteobacteria bacterium]|nr:2-oxoglutarate dehydrogenase complex dihydrolipoyllysine-residue succinyltransferase [Deltaproteobacteria bacterium]
MKIDVTVPGVGESIKEAILAEWYKKDGDSIKKDETLFALETDKVTLEVEAEAEGVLKILVQEGETVEIGAVVGTIDTEGSAVDSPAKVEKTQPAAVKAPKQVVETEPIPAQPVAVATVPQPTGEPLLSPSVRRLVAQKQVNINEIVPTGPGDRITKGDVLAYLEHLADVSEPGEKPPAKAGVTGDTSSISVPSETVVRKPMSPIRRRIAERLLEAKHGTAMLTTFNEIDMSQAMAMRSRYKDAFKERHQVGLGFMSFFIQASVQALKELPAINAFIEGQEMVYHEYYHLGVAVGSPKGLVVPVIRHADRLSFAGTEQAIVDYVVKIKENRLELADMQGGTFTITNGGVFGSLLSTPILNTPQSAILGMHKIEKRAVVVDDEIVIRPMMYVALSYDHRIVDGKDAVTFLKRIKECVENPERILMEI